MHSSIGSNHSSRSPEAKLFHVKFSDLHVSKEDSVKSWCHRLESQLFEAEYLADEYSCLVPTDVSAIVHPSQKKSLWVVELRQLAWQSDGAWVVEACWHLIVQCLMGTLIVKHVTKTIEATLLCTTGAFRGRGLFGDGLFGDGRGRAFRFCLGCPSAVSL